MMRVALGATSLLTPLTGIGQYTRQLALALQGRSDLELQLFLGTRWGREVPPLAAHGSSGWRGVLRRIPGMYEVRRLVQEHRFRSCPQADLYHEPNIVALPFEGPTVITVHDLSWIRHPESHPGNRVRAFNRRFEAGLRRAAIVLTDSRFVREEVISEFGFPAERIRAVPLGVEPLFIPLGPRATADVLARHGLLHGSYLLAVGTLEPRKNLITALRAYKSLPAPLRASHPLVVVGMKGWKTTALEREMEPLLRAGQVRQLGYLPRADLAVLTAGALALVYPSIYEGFGLPPLEAMACGVPTITSNASSIPEVVGDAGLMAAAHDVDGIAQHMRSLLEEPALRERLAARALARSKTFSWARCAEETLEAYAAALGASSRAS